MDEGARSRYERLLKNKGATVVVGVQHGVCGGWPQRLPAKHSYCVNPGGEELGTGTGCGRILNQHAGTWGLAAADYEANYFSRRENETGLLDGGPVEPVFR